MFCTAVKSDITCEWSPIVFQGERGAPGDRGGVGPRGLPGERGPIGPGGEGGEPVSTNSSNSNFKNPSSKTQT